MKKTFFIALIGVIFIISGCTSIKKTSPQINQSNPNMDKQIEQKPVVDTKNPESCRTYTIYPFKNKPSSQVSDFGIYIHSTNESMGCSATINYDIKLNNNEFDIVLKDTSYTAVCPAAVGMENGQIPNAKIILGNLDMGEYKINVKNCDIIDNYTLKVENKILILKIANSTNGQLSPNNKGVFKW